MTALHLPALLRLSTLGFSAVFALVAITSGNAMAAPAQDLYKLCRQVKNNDTVRPYSHELYAGTVKAFKKLFPDAEATPEESELETQANYRCMNGKVLACFVGANLPCSKLNASRDNPGADEFCKQTRMKTSYRPWPPATTPSIPTNARTAKLWSQAMCGCSTSALRQEALGRGSSTLRLPTGAAGRPTDGRGGRRAAACHISLPCQS